MKVKKNLMQRAALLSSVGRDDNRVKCQVALLPPPLL